MSLTKANLARLDRLERKAREAKAQVDVYRQILRAKCNHPAERCEDYEWEGDDGYGRPYTQTGIRCTVCRRMDQWKNGSFYQ